MKRLLLLAALAAAVATTSCSKEDGGNNAETSGNLISMRAVMDKTDVSRASAIDNDRFNTFHVMADDGSYTLDYLNTVVYKLDDEWKYAPKAYFPANGDALSFYAYAPLNDLNMVTPLAIASDGVVSFEYSVPNNQATDLAEDLLVASVVNVTPATGTSTEVKFEFEHALSAATFKAVNKNSKDGELVYVISSIKITNLEYEGTFTYPDTWEYSNNTESYIAPLPESGVALEPQGDLFTGYFNLLTANDILMILPQEVTNDNEIVITYNVRDGGGNFIFGKNAERKFPLDSGVLLGDEFVAGTRYNFTFTFASLNEITMDAEVADWNSENVNL